MYRKIMLPMILQENRHIPVLLREVLEALRVERGKLYIDATAGGGGYTEAIAQRGGKVLALDADSEASAYVARRLEKYEGIVVKHGNFKDIRTIATSLGFEIVDGIVFDLGISSNQLEQSGRGFSYQRDEPLDLRFDTEQKVTGADIINTYSKEGLYEIFSSYSEELNSRAIAEAIIHARRLGIKVTTTRQLRELIGNVCENAAMKKHSMGGDKTKTLSRIFQALRISVNDELESLKIGISDAVQILGQDAKLCVVSFHSLEDRIVKTKMKEFEQNGLVSIITKKPVVPSRDELFSNSRARSAKLRICIKL